MLVTFLQPVEFVPLWRFDFLRNWGFFKLVSKTQPGCLRSSCLTMQWLLFRNSVPNLMSGYHPLFSIRRDCLPFCLLYLWCYAGVNTIQRRDMFLSSFWMCVLPHIEHSKSAPPSTCHWSVFLCCYFLGFRISVIRRSMSARFFHL